MDENLLSIIKKEKEDLEFEVIYPNFKVDIKFESDYEDWSIQNECSLFQLNENKVDLNSYDDLIQDVTQQCSKCFMGFDNSFSLYKHNLSHLEIKLISCTRLNKYCNICNIYFEDENKISQHKEKHEVDKLGNILKCPFCKHDVSSEEWRGHVTKFHKKEYKNPYCKECDIKFKHMDQFKKHYLHIHFKLPKWTHPQKIKESVTSVQCDICSSVLKNRDIYNKHMVYYHSDGKFQCDICKSIFKSKPYLTTHILRVHYNDGKQHKCFCGKSFKSPRYLSVHKQNAHGIMRKRTKLHMKKLRSSITTDLS